MRAPLGGLDLSTRNIEASLLNKATSDPGRSESSLAAEKSHEMGEKLGGETVVKPKVARGGK